MRDDRTRVFFLLTALFLSLIPPRPAVGQDVDAIREKYEKLERMIPMRDGTRLHTVIYQPKDRTRRYPILIERTPYGSHPYGPNAYRGSLGPSRLFADSGYIFVYQDVRGCFLSEGTFEDIRPALADRTDPRAFDESTDAYDTVSWLLANLPNQNGRVGFWGVSYPGFYAVAALIHAHPAVKAVSPQAPVIDWFLGDDTHHNGAFFLHQEFNFDAWFGVDRVRPSTSHGEPFSHGTPDAYDFFLGMGPIKRANELYFKGKRRFWSDVTRHGTYDAFWQDRAILPRLSDVKPAVLNVGGWFDAQNLYGPLHAYQRIEASSPSATNRLVMGPWSHGGWMGERDETLRPLDFGRSANAFYRDQIEFPFFEHHLKGAAEPNEAEAWVFQTGKNIWRSFDRWPPSATRRTPVYLENGGRLLWESPSGTGANDSEYVSDPNRPVPYTQVIAIDCPESYMVEDQRFAARRTDVLVFATERLAADLTIAGPIEVELFVSTSGTDSDFVVKVIDVYPDDQKGPGSTPWGGYQQLLRGDVMRGKFRESFERPRSFTPNEPTRVAFPLQDVFHTFPAGHRLMVQIHSSWFPLVDRNPQTFVDIYQANAEDFRKATQRVHHAPGRASRLILPVLP